MFVSVISVYRVSTFIHPEKVNRANLLLLQQHFGSHSQLGTAESDHLLLLSTELLHCSSWRPNTFSRALQLWLVKEGTAHRWERGLKPYLISQLDLFEISLMLKENWLWLYDLKEALCYMWICFCITKNSGMWLKLSGMTCVVGCKGILISMWSLVY